MTSSLPRLCQKYPQRDTLMLNMDRAEVTGGGAGNEGTDFPRGRYLACRAKPAQIAVIPWVK